MGQRRLNKTRLGGLEIVGYSVAGEETVVAVPELDVCFDIGKAPDELLPINHLLLSHGHMDHAAGIAYYCSQRDFREIAPAKLLVSPRLAVLLEDLFDCWGRIDGNRPPAVIVPMEHGAEYELRRNLYAFAFRTNHTNDALGFTITERRQKLKQEYHGTPGPEIARLRREGVPVTYTLNLPLVTYLGDTMGGAFLDLACVRHSKVLIAECTFFEDDHQSRAAAGKHFHVDDLARLLPEMENEHILLIHVSRRTDLEWARQRLETLLPDETMAKVRFLMGRARRRRKEND